jgi:hypothetical protein
MSFSYPPLVTTEVELMPCSSIMFFSVVEGFLGLLFFFMTRYWLQYFGFDEQTYAANAGLFKIVALLLITRGMIYFYGGRCISNTTAQGSIFQRSIVGGGILFLVLVGSLPSGMSYMGIFNLLGAGYTWMAVKRYQAEERGDEDFGMLDEMRWAFLTPLEE